MRVFFCFSLQKNSHFLQFPSHLDWLFTPLSKSKKTMGLIDRTTQQAAEGDPLPSADRSIPVSCSFHGSGTPYGFESASPMLVRPYPLWTHVVSPYGRTSTQTLLGIHADKRIRPKIHTPFAFLLNHYTQSEKYY